MKTIRHKIYLLPGPDLEQLISDRANGLKSAFPLIERVSVVLWVQDTGGIRKKSCEVSIRLRGGDLRVTKSGPTHVLAVLDAVRTVRRRIVCIGQRNGQTAE